MFTFSLRRGICAVTTSVMVLFAFCGIAKADLVLRETIETPGGGAMGLAYANASNTFWIYYTGGGAAEYSRDGKYLGNVIDTHSSSIDGDISISPRSMFVGNTLVNENDYFFFNDGEVKIYSHETRRFLGSTNFRTINGQNGGTFNSDSDTFFLLGGNRMYEFDKRGLPIVESNLGNGWQHGWSDIEYYSKTGHLYAVSHELSFIRVVDRYGEFVRDLQLPDGVSLVTGLSFDDKRNELWAVDFYGEIYRMGIGIPEPGVTLAWGIAGLLLLPQRRKQR